MNMKTMKEVSTFCNVFTFYDHYRFERVIELNHDHDCFINVLSKCNHNDENVQIRVLSVRDDKSLMVISRNVEYIVREIKNLRVSFLQLLCLEKLYFKKIR